MFRFIPMKGNKTDDWSARRGVDISITMD